MNPVAYNHAQNFWGLPALFDVAKRSLRCLVLAILCVSLILPTLVSADITYTYDELGRLKSATNNAGETAEYVYDALGNVIQIKRIASSQLAITEFTPNSGAVGNAVTIYGSGFSATPTSNVVKFNGVTATVTTASVNTLTATVPTGATTGKISVTVGATTATSAQNFSVTAATGAPTISSFTPTSGVPGTEVTVNGARYDTTPGATKVELNNSVAVVTSVTATQLKFLVPENTSSGKIRVVTPGGIATSAGEFVIPPPGINGADIVATKRITTNGAVVNLAVNTANKNGLLLFDGTQGQYLTLNLSAWSAPVGGAINYTIYAPNNISIYTGSLSSTVLSIHIPGLPTSGTYSILFSPGAQTFSADMKLVSNAALSLNGTATNAAIAAAGQSVRYIFTGTAGQNLGLGISNMVFDPVTPQNSATVDVFRPDGASIGNQWCDASSGGCSLNLRKLPLSGTFSVIVTPSNAAKLNFTATLSTDITGSVSANTTFNLNITRSGQNGGLTFTGAAGQHLGLTLSNVVLNGSTASGNVLIFAPNGTTIASANFHGGQLTILDIPALPSAGTYTIFIDPPYAATASMAVLLTQDVNAALTVNGTASNVSITQTGQTARLTFSGTAGQNLGLGITNLVFNPTSEASTTITVYAPDGSVVTGQWCDVSYGSCGLDLTKLPTSGSYSVVVTPNNGAKLNFTATLSTDTVGTLTAGTALNLNLSRAGQNGRLTFSGTAGQNLGLTLSSVVVNGSASNGNVFIYAPDGSYIAGTSFYNGNVTVIDLPKLSATGTYTVFIDPPYGVTASMAVLLTQDVSAALTVNGAASNVSITQTGQTARLTFSGTAGQNLGLGISSMVFNPTTETYADVSVYAPDGSLLIYQGCDISNGGCNVDLTKLSVSGTYSIVVTPNNGAKLNFTATLSTDVSGSLSAGTTFNLNLNRPGQNGRLTFSGTAGQHLGLTINNVALNGSTTSGNVWVYAPNGTYLASTSFYKGQLSILDLPALPAAGTYTVVIDPPYAATASMGVLLTADVGGTLAINGTPSNVSITQIGQAARLKFTGTAGQNLGLGITSLVFDPTTETGFFVAVYAPDGAQLANQWCDSYYGGCGLDVTKLPVSGTYSVAVIPNNGAKLNFTATLSTDTAATLTAGTALNLNLSRAGQNGRLTFNGTVGQNIGLALSNVVVNGSTSGGNVLVYAPDGSYIAGTQFYSGNLSVQDLPALPATGAYTIFIDPPYGATASMSVLITQDVGGALSVNGTASNVSITQTGQTARLTFSGTAGQNLGVGITNLVFNPTSETAVLVAAYAPDGSQLTGQWCDVYYGGCGLNLSNIPVSGTYAVVVSPNNGAKLNFTATLSTDLTGTLTLGTTLNVSLSRAGRNGRLTFNGTAGQNLRLALSNVVVNGSSNGGNVLIFAPDGSYIAGTSFYHGNVTSTDIPTLTMSGAYTVFVDPPDGATASMGMLLSNR